MFCTELGEEHFITFFPDGKVSIQRHTGAQQIRLWTVFWSDGKGPLHWFTCRPRSYLEFIDKCRQESGITGDVYVVTTSQPVLDDDALRALVGTPAVFRYACQLDVVMARKHMKTIHGMGGTKRVSPSAPIG